ncbi:MAG: choline dehydrogenase [Gammaproteobacteria bacterium]|nr:choline dehydrogenase [Gammaproteobacteria bacterium]
MPSLTTTQFDTIIVGAGSAGCVLANRLSADPARQVLLLEAGGSDNWHWLHIPVGYLFAMGNPRADWCYSLTPQAGLNGRTLPYPRGRVLGGCSAINGMIYMRGQSQDYDNWQLPGWSWQEVLPRFRRSENYFAGANEFHGAKGELRVEEQRLKWDILDAWQQACTDYGIPPCQDFNTGNNEGVGLFHVNQINGVRCSANRAFLKPVRQRKNLTVATGVMVDKLVWEGSRVVGVDTIANDKPQRIRSAGQVILSAGAVSSPCILQRSGVGGETQLQQAGIVCKRKLEGVGGNLQDHLQIRVQFRVDNAVTLNCLNRSWLGKAKMGLEYLLKRSGPLSMAPSQLGAFFKSDESLQTPNLEYHVQPMSADQLGIKLHPFPGITASVCNLRPSSRGRVDITSADPAQPPRIDPNYLSTADDQKVAARSIEITREISRQHSARQFNPVEIKPGPQLRTEAELARAAGDIATTIFHPVGTCKMGTDNDQLAVTDAQLRVRGFDNLYIADASVMPTITSGNTHAPVVMIAETLAEILA